MDLQNWYDQETEVTEEIKVEELETICAEAQALNVEIKKDEATVKEKKAVLTKMKSKILAHLQKLGKSKYVSEAGTFYSKTEFSVKTPKTEQEKKDFFAFLQKKDIYWQYATVNSRSLQSLYKALLVSEGDDFKMPGVAEPTTYEQLAIRAK